MPSTDTQADSGLRDPTGSTTAPTPIGTTDHEAQRQWEHYQVQRGVERYQRSLVQAKEDGGVRTKRLDEIEPGMRIASDLIGPLVVLIRAKQSEHLASLADTKMCKLADDLVAITMLPAETLAACAILTALASSTEATYLGVARDCGARVQHEIEYTEWQQAEAAAARDRKESKADFVPDLFKLMVKRNDEVDMRVFNKWSKKAALFTKGDWNQAKKARIGGALVAMLVECNGWFEVKEEFQVGHNKTKLMFRMTEMGFAVLSRLHDECEYQRPFMLPMICEPRDYEYLVPVPEVPFDALE